jgi:hypothetical protein
VVDILHVKLHHLYSSFLLTPPPQQSASIGLYITTSLGNGKKYNISKRKTQRNLRFNVFHGKSDTPDAEKH